MMLRRSRATYAGVPGVARGVGSAAYDAEGRRGAAATEAATRPASRARRAVRRGVRCMSRQREEQGWVIAVSWARARAARGRGAGPRLSRPPRRTRRRPRGHRQLQLPEDLRPARLRTGRRDGRRGHPAREVPRLRRLRDAPDPAPGTSRMGALEGRGAEAAGAGRTASRRSRPGSSSTTAAAWTSPRRAPARAWPCTSSATRATSRGSPGSAPTHSSASSPSMSLRKILAEAGRAQIKGVLRTRAPSPGSATPTRTRSCTRRRCPRSSRPTASTADEVATGSTTRSAACSPMTVARADGLPASELKGEKKSHMAVHGRTGEKCPVCGDVVREVSLRRPEPAVLRDLPDRRQAAGRPADVEAAEVVVAFV